MAHFRGMLQGSRGLASRLGTRASGLWANLASWQGAVSVRLFENNGRDYADVSLQKHHGAGTSRELYYGPVDGKEVQENAQSEGGATPR